MYCINVKEQFDVCFMIKAPIFSRQAFNMFQAHSVLESTYYLFWALAMFSFSAIVFNSTIETDLSSLHRKKMISAFDVNKNIVGSPYSFLRKKNWLVSRKPSHLAKATTLQCFSQKIFLEGQSGPWRPFLGANFLGKGPINWKFQKEKCVRVPRKIKQFIRI